MKSFPLATYQPHKNNLIFSISALKILHTNKHYFRKLIIYNVSNLSQVEEKEVNLVTAKNPRVPLGSRAVRQEIWSRHLKQ